MIERQKAGFALLLFGLIFAAPGETSFWIVGFFLGLIGLVLVVISEKKK